SGVARFRKNQRLTGDLFQGNFRAMRQRISRTDHEAKSVAMNVMHFQVRRLGWQRHDADVDGAVLDALQNLMTEVSVDADVHQRKPPLKLRENIRKQIKAGRFIRTENDWPLNNIAAIGDNLDRFIAKTQKPFGVFEQHFASWRQLDGFG